MRIDAYQQVQQMYGAKQPHRLQKSERRTERDQLQISTLGQELQVVKNTLENTSEVREDVVEKLKNQMESGSYKVGVDAFANHLFEKYNELNLGSL